MKLNVRNTLTTKNLKYTRFYVMNDYAQWNDCKLNRTDEHRTNEWCI